jgi:hypothetical protein
VTLADRCSGSKLILMLFSLVATRPISSPAAASWEAAGAAAGRRTGREESAAAASAGSRAPAASGPCSSAGGTVAARPRPAPPTHPARRAPGPPSAARGGCARTPWRPLAAAAGLGLTAAAGPLLQRAGARRAPAARRAGRARAGPRTRPAGLRGGATITGDRSGLPAPGCDARRGARDPRDGRRFFSGAWAGVLCWCEKKAVSGAQYTLGGGRRGFLWRREAGRAAGRARGGTAPPLGSWVSSCLRHAGRRWGRRSRG